MNGFDYYYEKALNTNFYDQKSKRAAKAKQADLKMMYYDFNFKDDVRFLKLKNVQAGEAIVDLLKNGNHVYRMS